MRAATTAAAGLLCGAAHALPMASVDSWMVMGEFDSAARELAANHAFTRHDALGITLGRSKHDVAASALARTLGQRPAHFLPGRTTREVEYAALSYTRLLQRWNLPHAQANLWFVGDIGVLREADHGSRTMARPALLADYETTRVYLGSGADTQRARDFRHDSAYLRAGFSFYEADYDEIQPWLVLEWKRERQNDLRKEMATPMLRLIHKRWFIEAGANRDGGRFNFMWTH